MEQLAAAQPGYLSFKSYVADDGEVIALSEWESEQAARLRLRKTTTNMGVPLPAIWTIAQLRA